jgi:hypothetical protein
LSNHLINIVITPVKEDNAQKVSNNNVKKVHDNLYNTADPILPEQPPVPIEHPSVWPIVIQQWEGNRQYW